MDFEYIDDITIADAAFIARGRDMEEMFVTAADATMNLMVDPLDSIEAKTTRTLNLRDDAVDMLLFQFLQEFIYYKDAENLLLRAADVRITEDKERYSLTAEACGEPMDVTRHRMSVDVKAVTLHRFAVRQTENGWEATVVLDI